jgi:hypothetical protein
MTRIPRDQELVAQGKILAAFASLSEGGKRRTMDRLREVYDPSLSFTASARAASRVLPATGTTRALAEALAPMIAGRRAGDRTEGAEPDWDMRPPALDSRGPGT